MDWSGMAVAVTAVLSVIGGNAYVMKIIIDNAVLKAINTISKEYVTKDDFDRHIKQGHARSINVPI